MNVVGIDHIEGLEVLQAIDDDLGNRVGVVDHKSLKILESGHVRGGIGKTLLAVVVGDGDVLRLQDGFPDVFLGNGRCRALIQELEAADAPVHIEQVRESIGEDNLHHQGDVEIQIVAQGEGHAVLLAGAEGNGHVVLLELKLPGLLAGCINVGAAEGHVGKILRQAENAERDAFPVGKNLPDADADGLASTGKVAKDRTLGIVHGQVVNRCREGAAEVGGRGTQRAACQRNLSAGIIEQGDLECRKCRIILELDQSVVGACGRVGYHRIGTVDGVQDLDDVAAGLIDGQGGRRGRRDGDPHVSVLNAIVRRGRIDRPEIGGAGSIFIPTQTTVFGLVHNGGFPADPAFAFSCRCRSVPTFGGNDIIAELATPKGLGLVAGNGDFVAALPDDALVFSGVCAIDGFRRDGRFR